MSYVYVFPGVRPSDPDRIFTEGDRVCMVGTHYGTVVSLEEVIEYRKGFQRDFSPLDPSTYVYVRHDNREGFCGGWCPGSLEKTDLPEPAPPPKSEPISISLSLADILLED